MVEKKPIAVMRTVNIKESILWRWIAERRMNRETRVNISIKYLARGFRFVDFTVGERILDVRFTGGRYKYYIFMLACRANEYVGRGEQHRGRRHLTL